MNDYIVVLKLINGQDVVAVIVDEDDKIVEVEFPFLASYSPTAGGAVMSPYSLYTDDNNFRFRTDSIITISRASDKVAEYYMELTQDYSDYLDKKHTVSELDQLLDTLDIDSYESAESDIEPIKVMGNTTKH